MSMASASYSQYPSPLAKYDEVVADPQLFMSSLEKLHSVMGTKFMIPIIGGRNLDLHKLFVEVTSRGGIEEVIREKRWKEDCGPPSTGALESSNTTPGLVHGLPKMPPAQAASIATSLQPRIDTIEFVPGGAASTSSVGNSVIGVIDGKFDSGYLVTVKMGKETLKGALYQAPQVPLHFN